MFKDLFQPEITGESASDMIKKFAKAIAFLIFAYSILLSLGIVLVPLVLQWEETIVYLISVVAAVCISSFGYVLSRIVLSFLFAYGEITERIISIDNKLSPLKGQSKNNKGIDEIKNVPSGATPRRTGPWTCSFCGNSNSVADAYCKACGTEDINL